MPLTLKEERLLRAVLKLTRYAKHKWNCDESLTGTCTCGLESLKAEFAEAMRDSERKGIQ